MPQAFACLLLLLASLADGLVILPYKPRAQPPHGLSSHPLGVRFMHNLTEAKHARLYFKLHHRDLTNTNTTDSNRHMQQQRGHPVHVIPTLGLLASGEGGQAEGRPRGGGRHSSTNPNGEVGPASPIAPRP